MVGHLKLQVSASLVAALHADTELARFHDSVEELRKLADKTKERDYEMMPHPAGNRKARRAYEAQQRKAHR